MNQSTDLSIINGIKISVLAKAPGRIAGYNNYKSCFIVEVYFV